jgi:hypothetical protein
LAKPDIHRIGDPIYILIPPGAFPLYILIFVHEFEKVI